MTENVVQTLQHLIQDVIAPNVRELKVRRISLEKQMDVRFNASDEKSEVRFAAVEGRLNALDQKMDIQFRALMAAIAESKAQTELTNLRVLEAQRH